MDSSATDLGRLNDLAIPTDMPWWPLAPGWYGVIVIALAGLAVLAFRSWKKWRSNAYRRAARRELESADNATDIATILRRSAFVIASRKEVAGLDGDSWLKWLTDRSPTPLSPETGRLLIQGPYSSSRDDTELESLRHFADDWITHHRPTDD